MSIIYDSLKKIEKDKTTPAAIAESSSGQTQPRRSHDFLKPPFLYAAFAVIGIVLASALYQFLFSARAGRHKKGAIVKLNPPALSLNTPNPYQRSPEAQAQTASFQETLASFTLNGIFFSQENGFALINNQIVKVGDSIEGAIVEEISEDKVMLRANGIEINLSTSGRQN
jgi:hypothetical protein